MVSGDSAAAMDSRVVARHCAVRRLERGIRAENQNESLSEPAQRASLIRSSAKMQR
jgi:hypothetical protein